MSKPSGTRRLGIGRTAATAMCVVVLLLLGVVVTGASYGACDEFSGSGARATYCDAREVGVWWVPLAGFPLLLLTMAVLKASTRAIVIAAVTCVTVDVTLFAATAIVAS